MGLFLRLLEYVRSYRKWLFEMVFEIEYSNIGFYLFNTNGRSPFSHLQIRRQYILQLRYYCADDHFDENTDT